MTDPKALLRECRNRAAKFVAKVRDGRAQSKETFADMLWMVENIDAALSAPASGKVCTCEDAARICETEAASNTGYEGAIGTPSDWALEANAMKYCATIIRASCRHAPTPSGEDVREACAVAACFMCQEGSPLVRYDNGVYMHEKTGDMCFAQDIRALDLSKKNSAPTDEEPSRG